jgi:hypothetical protein
MGDYDEMDLARELLMLMHATGLHIQFLLNLQAC